MDGHLVAFIVGLSLHLFLFRVGEWDLSTLRLIADSLVVIPITIFAIYRGHVSGSETHGETLTEAIAMSVFILGSLLAGLFSSMLVYRGFYHPLSAFPGPFLARFTGMYMTVHNIRKMQTFEDIQKLHETYGDVVRVGQYFIPPV